MQRIRKSNTGMFTQLISDARAAEWELVGPEDSDRLFYKMPWWKKVIVMAGGPTVNILIAFFIFWGVFATYGQKTDGAGAGQPVVDDGLASACCPYTEEGRACTADDPPSPAAEAGLPPGRPDHLASTATRSPSWDQLRELIRDNDDGQAVIGYERDGEQLTGTTNTTVEARPTSPTPTRRCARSASSASPRRPHVVTDDRRSALHARPDGRHDRRDGQGAGHLPVKVWDVGQAIVGVEERDPGQPGQHRRRRPARRRDRVPRGVPGQREDRSSC